MKGIAVLLWVGYLAIMHIVDAGTVCRRSNVIGVDKCPNKHDQDETIDYLIKHENCDMYYQCVHGRPVEKFCVLGLYFDVRAMRCERYYTVDCEDRNIPTTRTDTTNTTPVPTTITATATTASTTAFPPTTESDSTTTTSSTTTDFNENGCPVNFDVHWLLPHEYDCNLFYYCVRGTKVLRECSGDLHFNTELQVCDHQVSAGCRLPGKAKYHSKKNGKITSWAEDQHSY